MKQGRTVATNGPLLSLQVGDASPGDVVQMRGDGSIPYRAVLRANFAVDHLELVWNGAVVATLSMDTDRRAADVRGEIPVRGSGWLILRAWNDGPDPHVLDNYPYATTSPVYVRVAGQPRRSRDAGTYFLRWLEQLQSATERNGDYRSASERRAVLDDIARARTFYEGCASASPRH